VKKIGIITHYYKSKNYGGNLQAYALCKILQNQGYSAEQICFPRVLIDDAPSKRKNIFRKDILKVLYRKIFSIVIGFFANRVNQKHRIDERREKAFLRFNSELIPHSKTIYNKNTIGHCAEKYDVFITGSDQVWNFFGETLIYMLDFVPSDKIKLSYAASIARNSLTEEQKEIFRNSLKDYKAVSVREKSAEKLLEGLSPTEVQTVLDPTLLLTQEEWDCVCAERVIKENYVFCYFLGTNKKARKIAEKFARKKGLKLVSLPHTAGIRLMDARFGDEQLYDVSPEQFISLIKHASYVLTDSFHAVVFSNIYKKQYFVFNRMKSGAMSSRITDITELFNQRERFCSRKEQESLKYIFSLCDIDYSKENEDFENSRRKSIEFLTTNLED